MTKCKFCGKRKGKRECPVLKGTICTLCCGENRGRKIDCPEDCGFFLSHGAYQMDKVGDHFLSQRGRLHRFTYQHGGDKALAFLNLLDMVIYATFHRHPDTHVSIVLEGMEFLRQRLSPIALPSQSISQFGERLWKEVERFLKEMTFNKDNAASIVTKNIEFIRAFSDEGNGSDYFVKGLIGFVEKRLPGAAKEIRDRESSDSIVLPMT